MKPNHRAQPAEVSSASTPVGFNGSGLFDPPHTSMAHDPLSHDSQALHMAIPRGQTALSPSIPPGPLPQTPKHMRDAGQLSLQSIQGLRGLHSARSVPDFHDLYDVPGYDISTAPGDPFLYDYDFQDPLSPTFYEMPLSSSQTLVLTSELSSVGSTASGSSSFLGAPPPVEGLGIAEPGWPQLSPRSRVQQNQPRVTKKASKQTLRQKRSRANLDQATSERGGSANGVGAANGGTNGTVNGAAIMPGPDRPSSPAPSTSTSSSAALSPPFPTSPRSPTRAPTRIVSATAVPGQQQVRPLPNVRHVPSTPFPVRGKAAASPAMQSPMRPSLSRPAPAAPRLQAAAAATALYTPVAPPPDASRRTSMAAAAAAAAASATQQSTTPGSRTPRVSPSTIVASASGRGPQQAQSAASPTPAARMHSSSKLVSVASDSSPAKGMFSQAQTAMPLSALPKPVQTARKVPSNQSMRRNQARKQPNVIPEMSSAMNQFQVELKPQPARKLLSMPSGRPDLEFELMHVADQGGHPGPMKKPLPAGYPPRSQSAGPHYAPHQEPLMDMNQMFFDAPSHEPWLFAGQQHQPPPHLPPPPQSVNGSHNAPMASIPRAAPLQHSHMHAAAPPPPPPLPQPMAPPAPQFTQMRPKTVVPVSNETSRVHPQGEPPQHVWVAHPPPPRTPRRRTPRQSSKQGSTRNPEPINTNLQGQNAQQGAPASAPVVSAGSANGSMMERPVPSSEPSSAVPISSQSAPPQPHLMARPLLDPHPVGHHPSGNPPSMVHTSMTGPSSMPDAPLPVNTAPPSMMHPSLMHAGLAVPPDMFSGRGAMNVPPLHDGHAQEVQQQEASQRSHEHQSQQSQELHPLTQLNDGLPSDGDFGFGQSGDYSNQEFLDTLEWVPNDLDTQWDFMDVLEQGI